MKQLQLQSDLFQHRVILMGIGCNRCSFQSSLAKSEKKYVDTLKSEVLNLHKENTELKLFILEQYKNQLIDFNKMQRSAIRAEDIIPQYEERINQLRKYTIYYSISTSRTL